MDSERNGSTEKHEGTARDRAFLVHNVSADNKLKRLSEFHGIANFHVGYFVRHLIFHLQNDFPVATDCFGEFIVFIDIIHIPVATRSNTRIGSSNSRPTRTIGHNNKKFTGERINKLFRTCEVISKSLHRISVEFSSRDVWASSNGISIRSIHLCDHFICFNRRLVGCIYWG